MWHTRQVAVTVNAQRFSLNAAEATREKIATGIGEFAVSFVESVAQSDHLFMVGYLAALT